MARLFYPLSGSMATASSALPALSLLREVSPGARREDPAGRIGHIRTPPGRLCSRTRSSVAPTSAYFEPSRLRGRPWPRGVVAGEASAVIATSLLRPVGEMTQVHPAECSHLAEHHRNSLDTADGDHPAYTNTALARARSTRRQEIFEMTRADLWTKPGRRAIFSDHADENGDRPAR
jgi:hypothetical protein